MRIVVVNSDGKSRQSSLGTREPDRIESQQDAPSSWPTTATHLPATARPLTTQPPIGITLGRLPPSIAAPVHEAAIQYTSELPVKIIMPRTATRIAMEVDTEREGVAPISR